MRKNISLKAATGIAPGIDLWLPHKLDQTRQEWRKLAREVETGIRQMEGDGVERDGVPWVDRSFELSTRHRECHHSVMVEHTTLDPQTLLDSASRPLRGPFTRWPRAADAVLAVAMFLVSLFHATEGPNQDSTVRALSSISIGGFIFVAVASGALYWRRSRPLEVLGLALVVLALSTALGYPYDYFGLPIALYSVGRYVTHDRWHYAGLAAAIAVCVSTELTSADPIEDIGGAFVILFLVWYMGSRIRIRGAYLRLLQERAAQLEREQESEASRAVAEERTRIARELHDVVAHQVSLMTVQAGAAKTVAANDPEAARRAMAAVEKAGRQALNELRHLLGVLRPDAEVAALGPQPGLADVPRLVENLRAAGFEVVLTLDGVPADLPARVELSAYRIIQEALTNVLKHAGAGARIEVRLSTDHHGVAIEVLDNGNGADVPPRPGYGPGHGLAGMRERVQLLGGNLDAGPRPGGGFRVVAHLPIGAAPI